MATIETDICVIGGGSGGLSVAAATAAFGVPVVLIERDAMGGDCLNTGCVPSKALIAAAKHAHGMRSGGTFGIRPVEPEVDFAAVMAHVQGVIATIAPNDSVKRFTGLGVTVLQQHGRFVDAETVGAGDTLVKARRFVIATGSSAAVPPIPGLKDGPYLTNENVFHLTERPSHLLVLGGGPIGCELAQSFRRLGSQVTVVEGLKALGKDDPEAATIVLASLKRDGVVFHEGAKVVRVEHGPGSVTLVLDQGGVESRVEGSHLLVAAGRRAVMDGLDLEKGNVAYTPKGITVDAGLRSTTNPKVYAVGDVAGGLQFTHAANYHAGLVVRNALFRLPVKVNNDVVPWCTYTSPELAQAGVTEAVARERHGDSIRVLKWPFHENDRAIAERADEGFVKVVTDKRGRVLGGTVVGEGAGDIANMLSLAISKGLDAKALSGFVSPYPTRPEVLRRAGITFFTPSLKSPIVRGAVKLLRKLG
jgi:pyruvate/2-oxoglutarate dehydrogenase complex dihydrolipoamide dehydrogenase (E3) component